MTVHPIPDLHGIVAADTLIEKQMMQSLNQRENHQRQYPKCYECGTVKFPKSFRGGYRQNIHQSSDIEKEKSFTESGTGRQKGYQQKIAPHSSGIEQYKPEKGVRRNPGIGDIFGERRDKPFKKTEHNQISGVSHHQLISP